MAPVATPAPPIQKYIHNYAPISKELLLIVPLL